MSTKKNTFPVPQELRSELDLSVNFVLPSGQEARYVRRSEDEVAGDENLEPEKGKSDRQWR